VEQLGLLLGEEQFEAPRTVHPCVTQDDEKIPFGQNPSLLRGELMATTWTSELASLPLAERASRMATPRDFKILESRLSPVRKDMSLAHPFYKILSTQIGQIRAGRTRRVAKVVYQIFRVDPSLYLHQPEGLMLIRLHFPPV